MKEFTLAAQTADVEVEEPIEFKIGDDVFHAYPPTPGQVAVMTSRLSDLSSFSEQAAAYIDFFVGVLDKESHQVLVRRLMDRDDQFELEDVSGILDWLMEQWSARPTVPSSDSSPSRVNGGRKSTANSRAVASSRSTSGSIAS